MGSADRVTPHWGEIEPRSAAELFIPTLMMARRKFMAATREILRQSASFIKMIAGARLDSYRKAKSGHVLTRKVAVNAI
jgi:hypothetical protein